MKLPQIFALSFARGKVLPRYAIAAILSLSLPFAAIAAEDQTERVRELEKKLQKSMEMIEQLQSRMRAL